MVRAPLHNLLRESLSVDLADRRSHVTPLILTRVPLPIDSPWPPAHGAPPRLLKGPNQGPNGPTEPPKRHRLVSNSPETEPPTRTANRPSSMCPAFPTSFRASRRVLLCRKTTLIDAVKPCLLPTPNRPSPTLLHPAPSRLPSPLLKRP